MIRYIYILLTFTIFAFNVHGETSFDDGVKAHKEKDYKQATKFFREEFEQNPSNISAYFNYGVSSLSSENYGEALWAFEKVLKQIPNDTEAKENAEYAYIQLHEDKEYVPVLNGFQSGLYSLSSNTWAWISILGAVFFSLSIILFKKSNQVGVKRISLLSSVLLVILFFFSLTLSYMVKDYSSTTAYGIIVEQSIPYFADSVETAKGNIHEGTRLELVEVTDSICSVQFENQIISVKLEDIALI